MAAWPWGASGDEGIQRGVRAKTSSIQWLDRHAALAQRRQGHGPVPEQHPRQDRGAQRRGLQRGGRDVFTEHGHVAEGSGENVSACARASHDTAADDGVLKGITRDIVINLAKSEDDELQERSLSRSDLVIADELLVAGTADEVVPIHDDHLIGEPGPDHAFMQERFAAITAGEDEEFGHSWSTRGSSAIRPASRGGPDARGAAVRRDAPRRRAARRHVRLGQRRPGVALKLDELGVGFIEGGFPASNPKEIEFFPEDRRASGWTGFAHFVAFGMTQHKGAPAEADESLQYGHLFSPPSPSWAKVAGACA